MGFYINGVAAATAVVGYDLLQGTIHQQSSEDRVIKGAALKGSTAAGDAAVDLYADQTLITKLINTGAGVPNKDDIMPIDEKFIPAGSLLHAYVTDAPATNPIYIGVDLEDVEV